MKTTSYAGFEITFLQFVFILFGVQVGVAILSLPRKLAEAAGTDGWISVLFGWFISSVASLIIVQVMKNGPEGTLPDIIASYMGVWAGKAIALLFSFYFCFLTVDGLAKTILLTKTWLLPKTSSYILIILLLIPTYLIGRHGPRILGRYVELVIILSLWIPIVYLMPLNNAHLLHLLPVLKKGWGPIFTGVQAMIYPSLGMVATFILYPYLKNKERAVSGVLLSNSLTMLIYLFMTLASFIYFSPDEITDYYNPIISVLKSIEFRFIERIEVPFIAFYLLVFSLVWIPSIYFATFFSSWMFDKSDNRVHLRYLCLAIVIVNYFYTPNYNQSTRMETWLSRIGFCLEYILPICLLIYITLHNQLKRRSLS
ncbi:germination protein [Paenibacillus baekrokdamisoli]|uniref:Germination protein n=1 Tax=Paenibacillus baekrokdamisoli TaxID=1712516 RepID=A0A3G9IKY9_9BACL|nr:endospore germination permease [Paenibacillus baekrokdamisoli]MBB3069184.1 spore germination protein (amino acid permease) [Paenibacillus baekrokdamisoli]BBH18842.1 germination protein [Paenibacillus baekrokdamisoli]